MKAYFSPTLQAWYLGPPPAEADRVWVCIHGRGASADSILPLGQALGGDSDAFVAPQAEGGSWYPYAFVAPRFQNEPYLSRAMKQLAGLTAALEVEGIEAKRQYWTGFSQGACLMLEHLYTHPRIIGGAAAFSGGMIGPPGEQWPQPPRGSLKNVKLFMSSSDPDPHIPTSRFNETARLWDQAGAQLHAELLPGHGHTISPGQISRAKSWLT